MKNLASDTITTRCFVCGSASTSSLISVNGYRVARCQGCGFVFVNPRPTPQSVARLYSEPGQNPYAREGHEPLEYESPTLFRIIREIQRYARGGKLLEVGCGRGDLLRLAQGRGFSVTGCDFFGGQKPQLTGAVFCDGALSEVDLPDDTFDVAVSRNTLEHVFDPRRELEEIRRVLKPGGYLYLKVPNVQFEYGPGCRLLFQREHVLEPPFHLSHFSPRSLRHVLGETGFDFIGWRVEQPTLRPQWKANLKRQAGYHVIRTMRFLSGGTLFPKVVLACFARKSGSARSRVSGS